MANRTKLTAKKIAFILDRVTKDGGNVSSACRAARISRTALYELKSTDESFAARLNAAIDQGIDVLEDEARRRAFDGTLRPVFQGGKRVGFVREYSDFLMGLMLKAHRKKYVERREHTGPDGQALTPGVITYYELPNKQAVTSKKPTRTDAK